MFKNGLGDPVDNLLTILRPFHKELQNNIPQQRLNNFYVLYLFTRVAGIDVHKFMPYFDLHRASKKAPLPKGRRPQGVRALPCIWKMKSNMVERNEGLKR